MTDRISDVPISVGYFSVPLMDVRVIILVNNGTGFGLSGTVLSVVLE
jgi:hypothetical protein